ncbi:M23 family metallopeptidase [Mesorhizobium sp. M0491]|uniref:M23 family metallopeptidase n=1 Tax=Mesorhizobium sp. M0491 TaxID=2956950 RepID=UPI00333D8290
MAKFDGSNSGLKVPARRLQLNGFGLRIENLDRRDPPLPYVDGAVPRTPAFNSNVCEVSAKARMPQIKVQCSTTGFRPEDFPIYWRLQTLDVMCRFKKVKKGEVGIPANYTDRVVPLSDEWVGTADTPEFKIFDVTTPVEDADGSDRVAGGHAILTVAARPNGEWLQDYVHLRIGGIEPGHKRVRDEVTRLVGARSIELVHMLHAIFAWEGIQFSISEQMHARFKKLGTLFDWPDDPPNYPLSSFDFGVGYSQFTDPDKLTTAIAWDWRENLVCGINVFFKKMKSTYLRDTTWRNWALRAWSAYNGVSKKNEITQYGIDRGDSDDGRLVSGARVPRDTDVDLLLDALGMRPIPPRPEWPVEGLPTVDRTVRRLANSFDDAGWDEDLRAEIGTLDEPKAVPPYSPFAFAASTAAIGQRYWPVLTENPERLTVAYETKGGIILDAHERRFLGRRKIKKNGTFGRYHVGIDLFAYQKDVVVACEEGMIVAFYPFYPAKSGQMTYALFLAIKDFVVNYGELRGDSPKKFKWQVGDRVNAGQKIGWISDTGMLHFETYVSGTIHNEHYYPRGDKPPHLLNPTSYLLECAGSNL